MPASLRRKLQSFSNRLMRMGVILPSIRLSGTFPLRGNFVYPRKQGKGKEPETHVFFSSRPFTGERRPTGQSEGFAGNSYLQTFLFP